MFVVSRVERVESIGEWKTCLQEKGRQ